jgi:hypothetical protein
MKAASIRIGPGVSCPSARPSTNSCGVSQPNWPTTCSCMKASIERPPPNVKVPTLKNKAPTPQSVAGPAADCGPGVATGNAEPTINPSAA